MTKKRASFFLIIFAVGLLASTLYAVDNNLENLQPIFKSNKDVKVAIDAAVYKDKVRQFYQSKLGINFNETESVVVNDLKINLKPVHEDGVVRMMVELQEPATGKVIETSALHFNDDLRATAEILNPDKKVQKVDIRLVELE